MDDSCAVCADDLEWVAYGSCGHREVCSTCVVRMRFILGDRRCCLCNIESPIVFVTKAMGDYTRVVTDFSQFPEGASEGQVGSYCYHEDTQAYFDDVDHYRIIKAMCRLSCSVCDSNGEDVEGGAGGKKSRCFKSIEQLKSHLYHWHKLFMCTLCLGGRKVFMCEQKLYTRAQLNRHVSSGDPEVDGNKIECGGFTGHPMCDYCRRSFYGDNELFMHLSREHYTCHICQRRHPGQHEYFRNYDDLEIHFRQEHFLCENEACLAKKFVFFQSESELKRHNAMEHGGNMSRAKRNSVLQVPTSFRYHRNEQERRRDRESGFHTDSSDNQLAMAIQASLEQRQTSQVGAVTAHLESLAVASESGLHPRSLVGTSQSSTDPPSSDEASFPPLSDREPVETSSRYAQALVQGPTSSTSLAEESFPPLPGSLTLNIPKSTQLGRKSIAAHLRQQSKKALKAQDKPVRPPSLNSLTPVNSQLWPTPNQELGTSTSANSHPAVTVNRGFQGPSGSSAWVKATTDNFSVPDTANSAWSQNRKKGLSHSMFSPNPVAKDSSGYLGSIPPVSSLSNGMNNSEKSLQLKEVHDANKTLVDRILSGLDMDEGKFSAFKSISGEYRQGLLDTYEYLSYVEQFGLSHLVPEIARLCPDVQKQRELTDAYSAALQSKGNQGTGSSISVKSTKGKGKSVDNMGISGSKDTLADNILSEVKELQAYHRRQEDADAEVLSKDGYRTSKGKPVAALLGEQSTSTSPTSTSDRNQNSAGSSKQRPKKTSKFLRMRLGDGSAASNLHGSDASAEQANETNSRNSGVRDVWQNGGGQKLFASSRDAS